MQAKIVQSEKRLCVAHDIWRRLLSRRGIFLRKTCLLSFTIVAVLAGCATPNSELPYYELPSNGGASVQPAIIEGTLIRRGRVCAYVFSVDGQRVGDRADCTAALPISPGKHIIAAWLDLGSRRAAFHGNFSLRATTTLLFDAAEGHNYKIALDEVSFTGSQLRALVWINDATTQTAVTEAKLVTSPLRTGTGPSPP